MYTFPANIKSKAMPGAADSFQIVK